MRGSRFSEGFSRCAVAVVFSLVMAGRVAGEVEFPLAITGATVVTGDGTIIENGVILIERGRIVDVGRDLSPPAGAEVIEASGMIAYPGFISAHSQLGMADEPRSEEDRQRVEDANPDHRQRALPETRAANRRGIHPEFAAHEHFDGSVDAIDAFRKSGFTTVLAAPRGGILGGTSALVNLSGAPLRRALVSTGVAQHASFEPWEPGEYPRSLLGAFASFRQVLLDSQRSVEVERYYERHPRQAERPPVDAAIVALRPLLTGDMPLIFEANSEHEIRRALDLAGEFDLRVIISGAMEAYKVIGRIKSDGVPLIVSLKFDEEPEYGKENAGSKKGKKDTAKEDRVYEPLKLRQERRRLWEEQVANVIRLHESEVEFSLSTRGFEKPEEFLENLRKVLDRGLPVDAAIAALSRAPAELFHLEQQLGLIEPGYAANIVVMTRPLSDKKTKTRYVIVDGEKTEYNGEAKPAESNAADDAPEEDESDEIADAAVEPGATDVDDVVWRCEIESDRIPKIHTGGDVLIRNGTVITVSGPVLAETSVLIRDGKIVEIGPDLTVPPGVTVIDAAGRFVMPGMVDCHSHMAVDGVNEGSLSVTAEVRVADTVRNDYLGIYRALAGGTTTTHAMHGSANPIGGQNVVFKLKYKRPVKEMIVRDAPPTMKWALGENVKQSNSPNAHGKRFPNGRMGVEAVIRDALLAGQQYAAAWERYRLESAAGRDVLSPRRDLRLEALARVLTGDIWVHVHCYRSDEIVRVLSVAEDFGIRVGVLQHVLEGYRVAPEIARHGAGASSFSDYWAYKVEAYGAIPQNAALMTEQGIISSINSDSPNTIRYLNVEAAKSIRWGDMSANAALRLVTLNPAIQLGLERRLGSVEVGKDGDLAIFDGHPLNTFSRNVMTLIEGEVYFEGKGAAGARDAGALEWNKPFDPSLPISPHRLFAVVGGTVHPVSSESIPNGTVVVRNGIIAEVGGDVAVPPGAGVLDATGLHVYPGLIDGSGSLGLTEVGSLRATRDGFDIAEFAPELRTASAVHPHSAHIRIAHSGGVTSQLVTPTGGRISGQSCLVNLSGWTMDEMLIADRVGLHMTVPSLPVRLTVETKETRKKEHEKALRELDAFMDRAKQYTARAVEPGRVESRDLRLESMVPYVRGEKAVVFDASSYKQILDTIAFAEKHDLTAIISGGREAWKLADVLAEKNIAVILAKVTSYPGGRFEAWDSVYACAGALDRAGVRWCFASDSASNAYDLGIEAGMAVAHGLDPDRAIHALTLGAADVLGVADRLGSLEPGKQADVIVTTHQPTQTVSKVTHMFIKGVPIDLSSMHTESYEKFRNRPKPHLPAKKDLLGPPMMTR